MTNLKLYQAVPMSLGALPFSEGKGRVLGIKLERGSGRGGGRESMVACDIWEMNKKVIKLCHTKEMTI